MPNPNDVYGTSNGFNSLKRVFDSFYNGDDLADEYYAIVLEVLPPKKTLDAANSSLWGLVSGFEYSHEFFARTLAPVSAENSVFTPHDFLLNPCSPVDYEKIKETGITLQSVIRSHTKFVESSASPNPEAVVNSIIKVRFSHKIEQGKKIFNLKKGEFIGMATPSQIKAAQIAAPSAVGCGEDDLKRILKEALASQPSQVSSVGGNTSGKYQPANRVEDNKIKEVVLHATDGYAYPEGSAAASLRWLNSPDNKVKASWHYAVDGAANIVQGVEDKDIAWHTAGRNSYSIGIEMVGPPNGTPGAKVRDPIRGASDGYGRMYTEVLLDTSTQLIADLCRKYNFIPSKDTILLHEHLDPGRRSDPGERYGNFDFDDFLSRVKVKYDAGGGS